ncbi:MAG TPA: HD domain-containing phosphohydrolase [Tepidisphaeraceae bacterium]|jgi:PAS domain S-box-containing protein|nr:HD domain-containing phosphohydrolase [Tepidisphaeraceae bacterium]
MSDVAPVADSLEQILGVLQSLSCGASVLDRSGRIISVNERCCQMMGRHRDRIEGRLLEDFYDQDPEARANIRKGMETFEFARDMEFYLPQPDGTRRPVVSSARPLQVYGPLADFRVVTMFDITAQKNAEEQVREQYNHIVELSNTVIDQARELKAYATNLEKRVEQRTEDLRVANLQAITMLAVAAEAKDTDTGLHVRRLQHYAAHLARTLGLPDADATEIGYSAILHDVGKLHVPDQILKKPGPLTADERLEMEQHTIIGHRIISPEPFFDVARDIARHHHENFNGTGYPDRIGGENIPLPARIVHLVDVYDALTSVRPYKASWAPAEAAASIRDGAGRMFDPRLVEAFLGTYQQESFKPPVFTTDPALV